MSLGELRAELEGASGGGFLWSLPRFRERAEARLGVPSVESLDDLPERATHLAVLGGGARMDEAKLWRRELRPKLWLAAIPSLWGSGAEASPVVAVNRPEGKHIEIAEELLPDARVTWPELAAEVPLARARAASGDALSHAVEGFLSPLGNDGLRAEIAEILRLLLELPLSPDPAWFEPSAAACAAQSEAGVGLIHGIAHQLEGPLSGLRAGDGLGFGHAKLCSLFLRPVLALNRELSPKLVSYSEAHGVDLAKLDERCATLFDLADYRLCLPLLEQHWRSVLLDPCTRTNSALVRPQHCKFFTEERFL